MSQISERNLALFIDFDNVALGARDSHMRFDVRLLMQRVLEKGKVVVKRAYADWHYYKEHMTPLHEAAIELIEVPTPKISGKNSADIRLVVDAIDLCYSKSHIDTFVIVSGDSDFSPLVSKLRENDKGVIGIGVRSSSSHLLISNCDEFVFYDDIYQSAISKVSEKVSTVPDEQRKLFDFLLQTTQSLLQESRGVLYSSLIKDTMKRKQPEFNEAKYGYSTFGDLLEDARERGLLEVERDSRAGGTLVVLGLGKGMEKLDAARGKSARRRSRRGGRRRPGSGENGAAETVRPEAGAAGAPAVESGAAPSGASAEPSTDRAASASGTGSAAVRDEDQPRQTASKASRKTARKTTPRTSETADEAAAGSGSGEATSGAASAARKKTAKKAAKKATKTATKKTTKTAAKKAAKKTAKKAPKKTTKKTARKAAGRKGGEDGGGGES